MTRSAAKSDAGNRSGLNEDVFGLVPEKHLWFVADGMGGHGHGSVASGIVRDTFPVAATASSLSAAILAAHEAILNAATADDELKNMGSTIVAAALQGSSCHIAWVGDSRAYLMRGTTLQQLTRDHVFYRELMELDGLDEAQARSAPNAHALVRALGMPSADAATTTLNLRDGDRILLCSDGLWHEVPDADIARLLLAAESPEQAVEVLVTQALANGGHDNVTVVVVAFEASRSIAAFVDRLGRANLYALAVGMLAALALAFLWHLFGGA